MERGGLDDGLREELAEDDSECYDDGGSAFREPGEPAPLATLPWPLLRLDSFAPGSAGGATSGQKEVLANLFVNLLGVGTLAAPRAFARAGLFLGLLALAGASAASRRAFLLLLELGLGDGAGGGRERPYLDMSRRAFGPQGFAIVLIAHLLYAGGLLAAYIAALADLIGQMATFGAPAAGAGGVPAAPPRIVLVLVALAVVTPGSFKRSLQYGRFSGLVCASGACGLLAATFFACIAELLPDWVPGVPQDPHGAADDVVLVSSTFSGPFAAATLFAAQFSVHVGAIEAFGPACANASAAANREEEMIEETNDRGFPGSCSTQGGGGSGGVRCEAVAVGKPIKAASRRAYAAATTLVGALGWVGYLRFGEKVSGNMLLSFRPNNSGGGLGGLLLGLAKLAYGLALVLASPFAAAACRNAALELFLVRRAGGLPLAAFRKASGFILATCGLVAWLAVDLAALLGIWGAWAAGPLAFIFPSLMSMELARQRSRRPLASPENAPAVALCLFGSLLTLSSFVGFIGLALSPPAGHSGRRVVLHSLANITTGQGFR